MKQSNVILTHRFTRYNNNIMNNNNNTDDNKTNANNDLDIDIEIDLGTKNLGEFGDKTRYDGIIISSTFLLNLLLCEYEYQRPYLLKEHPAIFGSYFRA